MKWLIKWLALATMLASLGRGAEKCTANKRLKTARSITTAFNEKDFAKSAGLINAFP
jgi:hypothetical protein